MENVRVFVGLDYSDKAIQVCVLDGTGKILVNRACANDWRELDQVVRRHGGVIHAGIESCSGAANLAEELVHGAGWTVDLAHPGYVARLKQSPDKTDFQDARLLADLVRVGYLPRVWLAPEPVRELRVLVRYRQQLVRQRRNAKLRIRAVLREQRVRAPEGLNAWTKTWLNWLRHSARVSVEGNWVLGKHIAEVERLVREIREVEKRLEKATAQDPLVARLLKEEGIGPVTAWTLRAEVGRFDRFRSGKQAARFCGLTPRNASSGSRQADAGLVPAANRELRAVLIQASHSLMQHSPRWRPFALRLRQAGKKGSVVAAAVANRWVRWLYHQVQAVAA